MVRVFDWSEVRPSLTRAMLVAAYTAKGQYDDADKCSVMDAATAAAQAEKTLGRPPKKTLAKTLVDPLRTEWAPRMSQPALKHLVAHLQLEITGSAKRAHPKTKADLVSWVRQRNRTDTFCLLLLAEFTRTHKVDNGTVKGHGATVTKTWTGPVALVGQGIAPSLQPHPHQVHAWHELDALAATSILAHKHHAKTTAGGLVVIPTGGGKTYTAVHWIAALLQANPDVRVLWLADRQELVDQAARAFQRLAPTLPHGVTQVMRVIHGNGSPASLLADGEAQIICATRQSVIGKTFGPPTKARLRSLLTHPVVVVVDEAHHAVAPTYRKLLDHIATTAPSCLMVGLTATPWPAGAGMTTRLHNRFPTSVVDVDPPALMASKVLARPIVHSLVTDEEIWLDPIELRAATFGELPPSVLRKLDRYSRNHFIVDTWLADRLTWGKTLVFACDIAHADSLGELFTQAGVHTGVVHSQSTQSTASALAAFRAAKAPRVLVSVDMLREGVDLPEARTAFLARPTRSPIVLRQMIGRVLRGPGAGGGEDIAHIVDLRDRWRDDVDILSPLDLTDIDPDEEQSDEPGDGRLPRILDERTQLRIPTDVLRRIAQQFSEPRDDTPHPGGLLETRLTGYYQLAERNVPVFSHTSQRWAALVADLTAKKHKIRSPIEQFDDLPVPRPSKSDVDAVVAFVRSYGMEPPLVEMSASVSPRETAAQLLARPAETEQQRYGWLRDQFDATLAPYSFPDFESFRRAVFGHIDRLLIEGPAALDAEAPTAVRGTRKLKVLTRKPSRQIEPLFASAVKQGRYLLADEPERYAALLGKPYLPEIKWTTRPVTSTLAYWAPRISGKKKGTPIIRVNSALQAPRTLIPDEALEYLIWHELCHHVLPGHGHNHEFRRLEALWPDAASHDAFLDRLCETYDLGKSGSQKH